MLGKHFGALQIVGNVFKGFVGVVKVGQYMD
jgi:hypothetical protein